MRHAPRPASRLKPARILMRFLAAASALLAIVALAPGAARAQTSFVVVVNVTNPASSIGRCGSRYSAYRYRW